MSQNQKMLKIMSFIAVIAAFAMAVYAVSSIASASTSLGLLDATCVVVQCLLDAVIGVWGVSAANKPARTCSNPYALLVVLSVVLNIVAVVVTVLVGGFPWASIINAVVVLIYGCYARNVRQEALR